LNELIRVRQACRLCGSSRMARSVALAEVPIVSPNVGTQANGDAGRLTRLVAPLDTYLCQDCGLTQLVHVVDPQLIYSSYLYRTSVSLGLAQHFQGLSQTVISRAGLKGNDLVVEFGSNDGTLLSFFKDAGMRVRGVDPAQQIAAEATRNGISTLAEFFNVQVAKSISLQEGDARAIIANNAMANIDDLAEVLGGVRTLLAPDGVFVFETQYALDVFEKTLLDVIYHEHISTFSVQPVSYAARRHGLVVFDAERISTKGGSIRFWLQREDGTRPIAARVGELIELERKTGLYDLGYYQRFADKVRRIRAALHRRIDDVRQAGGTVGGYGTSVGCAALIHQFELAQHLCVLFDDTPFKERLQGPGYDLPVMTAEGVYQTNPALIVVLAWRYAKPIVERHRRYIEAGGRFVIPLPDVAEIAI
jgi:SAM-dependent methyltransferase